MDHQEKIKEMDQAFTAQFQKLFNNSFVQELAVNLIRRHGFAEVKAIMAEEIEYCQFQEGMVTDQELREYMEIAQKRRRLIQDLLEGFEQATLSGELI
jgi:hypothetical protein